MMEDREDIVIRDDGSLRAGLNLCQECFKVLGFPTNPIGKTVEILVYTLGERYDDITGYSFDSENIRRYESFENRLSQVVAAHAWVNTGLYQGRRVAEPTVTLVLHFERETGSYRTEVGLSNLTWHFRISQQKELVLEKSPEYEDKAPSIDVIDFNKKRVIVRILE